MRYLLPVLLLSACDWDQYQCDAQCDLAYDGDCAVLYSELYFGNPVGLLASTHEECLTQCSEVSQKSQQDFYHCMGQSAEEFAYNAPADQEYPECYGRWSCGMPNDY